MDYNRKIITKDIRNYLTNSCLTFKAYDNTTDNFFDNNDNDPKEYRVKNLLDVIHYCIEQEINEHELADTILSNFDCYFMPFEKHNF